MPEIVVSPGQNLSTVVAGAPAGTATVKQVIRVKAGTYNLSAPVTPKAHTTLIDDTYEINAATRGADNPTPLPSATTSSPKRSAARGAILDGGGAFNSASVAFYEEVTIQSQVVGKFTVTSGVPKGIDIAVPGVRVVGFEVRNCYTQDGVRGAAGNSDVGGIGISGGDSTILDGCWVHGCGFNAIRLQKNSTMQHCIISDCAHGGLNTSGGGSAISYNDIGPSIRKGLIYDPDLGNNQSNKMVNAFVRTDQTAGPAGSQIPPTRAGASYPRGSWFHHNYVHNVGPCPACWYDIEGYNVLFESNEVVDITEGRGIDYEVCLELWCRNNTFRNCTTGIFLPSTDGSLVEGNIVEDCINENISVYQQCGNSTSPTVAAGAGGETAAQRATQLPYRTDSHAKITSAAHPMLTANPYPIAKRNRVRNNTIIQRKALVEVGGNRADSQTMARGELDTNNGKFNDGAIGPLGATVQLTGSDRNIFYSNDYQVPTTRQTTASAFRFGSLKTWAQWKGLTTGGTIDGAAWLGMDVESAQLGHDAATMALPGGVVTNDPPTVDITSHTIDPASPVEVKPSFTVSGTSADSDGTVTKVQLRISGEATFTTANRTATGTATWTYAFQNLPVGVTSIFVRATDNAGATSGIVELPVTVVDVNYPPQITYTYPTNNAVVGKNFTLTGNAFDPDGSTVSVEVRVDSGPYEPATIS